MCRYVAITLLLVMIQCNAGPSPLRVTIDCSSEERDTYGRPNSRSKSSRLNTNIDSFCNLIHNAVPDAVKDGRFILMNPDMDQTGFSDTQAPVSLSPPKGFIPSFPKLKVPKLKVPKLNVPKLQASADSPRLAPRVGFSNIFTILQRPEDETSAERMERFKKGVRKMLHVVKVLGQIDQYLSERTRIIIDKVTKTFAE